MKVNTPTTKSVAAYIESIDIGNVDSEGGLEGTPEGQSVSDDIFSDQEQIVTVGGTLTQYSPSVDPTLRSVISNSLLLAHLNSKKTLGLDVAPTEWLTHYSEVLANIGWLPAAPVSGHQTFDGTGLEVKENLLAIVTALLSGAVPLATSSLIIELLQGLESSEKDKPWITLFDQETQSSNTQLFQLGHAYLNESEDPEIGLVAISMDAKKSFTQLLFFKWQAVSASLNHVSNKARCNKEELMKHEQRLSDKLHAHTRQFIIDVDI